MMDFIADKVAWAIQAQKMCRPPRGDMRSNLRFSADLDFAEQDEEDVSCGASEKIYVASAAGAAGAAGPAGAATGAAGVAAGAVTACTKAVASARRTFRAKVTCPLDLTFVVPEGMTPGAKMCVEGPHGPLIVQVPADAIPGAPIRVRLGPATSYEVTVPEGYAPGDKVVLQLPDGSHIQAIVPEGKEPGDAFEISPSVLMVQVPEGAREGDVCAFAIPEMACSGVGEEITTMVPQGKKALEYFEFAWA